MLPTGHLGEKKESTPGLWVVSALGKQLRKQLRNNLVERVKGLVSRANSTISNFAIFG